MQYLHQQAAALLAFSLEENNEPVKKYIQGYTGNHTASSAEYSQLFLSDLALDHVGFRPYLDCGKPLYATPDTARYLPRACPRRLGEPIDRGIREKGGTMIQ